MKKIRELAWIIGLFTAVVGLGIEIYDTLIRDEGVRKEKTEGEKSLEEELDSEARDRLYRILDVDKVPKSLDIHHRIMYSQFVLLAKQAQIPEREAEWIMYRVENGMLHHIMRKFSILCIDHSLSPPRKAMELSISFDWENNKINPVFYKENYGNRAIENQKIMDLAKMFANLFKEEKEKEEKVTIETRYLTVDIPSFEALHTLKATSSYTTTAYDTTINISNDDFKKLLRKGCGSILM